jgi:hypothetical protein
MALLAPLWWLIRVIDRLQDLIPALYTGADYDFNREMLVVYTQFPVWFVRVRCVLGIWTRLPFPPNPNRVFNERSLKCRLSWTKDWLSKAERAWPRPPHTLDGGDWAA